jgi:hypothetical protein|tara:strand:+ start:61 stop:255 length:195 start_codon:yes stop_codon:yes gene_type:complete
MKKPNRKKKFKKSFNAFNSIFTPKEYLELKGKSLIDNGIDCGFDFMDSDEFQNITEELRVKFND